MQQARDTGVTDAQVTELLRAASRAPSNYNSQPWRLQWSDGAVEVHGDPGRVLSGPDPDARELRLACGAALLNIRLAARGQGRRAHALLLPTPGDAWFLGRVRIGAPALPAPWEAELAAAIPRRRTDRHAFARRPVADRERAVLARAAQRERGWLVFVDGSDRRRLGEIARSAHREQRSDPTFVEEWDRWIGHQQRTEDGVPADLARREPRPDGAWRLRDFAGSAPRADDRPPAETEDAPTIAVVATFADSPLAHLQAGQAMQQVLLSATARGLATSFLAPPLEVPSCRREVRALLGGVLWPQVVLRIGLGRPVRVMPRRLGAAAP